MERSVSIRLGTTGKADVTRTLDEIGASGDANAKRLVTSFDRASEDIEAAMRRQANAAAKIAAITPQSPVQMRINDANSSGFGQWEGSARQSASAFRELMAAEEQLEARTRALVASIDPAYNAQQRFNREVGDARSLISAGTITLDQYCEKLRLEQSLLDQSAAGHGQVGKAAGANRAAMAGLSYQVQDTFTQLSMGANAFQVIAIQGGQAAGQFANVEGTAGNLARFMIGPWGLAFTAAALVLGPLIGKLLNTSSALDDATDKLKKDAAETETNRIAKERFARSAEGVTASIRAQSEALRKSADQERSAAERANILAKSNLAVTISNREKTASLIEAAIAQENIDRQRSAAPGQRGELGSLALNESSGRVAGLEAQLAANQKALDLAKQNLNVTRVDLAAESAKRSADPVERINRAYREQADAVKAAARERARSGDVVDGALSRELTGIERKRLAALKAEQDRQKAVTSTKRDQETLTANAVANMLRASLPGVQVTSTTGGKHVANSYHYRNQAVDFVPKGGMQSMDKADVRRLFESRGIDVVELLGPGDAGHSDHFHVAWTKGKLALDGFNDAAKRTALAAREAAQADKDLGQDLDEVVKRYDPARAAADEYRATLAKIDALVKGGKLTIDQAGSYRMAASNQEQARLAEDQLKQFQRLFGSDDPLASGIDGALRISQETVDGWNNEHARQMQAQENGVRTVAGLYRDLMTGGVSSIWDRFKQIGLDAVATIAAKWVIATASKSSFLSDLLHLGASAASGSSGSGSVPQFAAGTEYAPGGTALVGEHGPEIVSMPRGSRVSNAATSRRLMAASDTSSRELKLIVSLEDGMLNARIDGRVIDATVVVMQQAAPAIVDAATRNTMAVLAQPSI